MLALTKYVDSHPKQVHFTDAELVVRDKLVADIHEMSTLRSGENWGFMERQIYDHIINVATVEGIFTGMTAALVGVCLGAGYYCYKQSKNLDDKTTKVEA